MNPKSIEVATRDNLAPIVDYVGRLEADGRLTEAVQSSIHKAMELRREYDVVFYIAGALTGVDEQTKLRYSAVSESIGRYATDGAMMFGYAPHLHGTDPVRHPDVTPEEVRDIDHLFAAVVPDYHLNFLYPVAHGSAIEEAWAEDRGIPAIYLAPTDMQVSRLTRGMRNTIQTVRYDDFDSDGMAQLSEVLGSLHAQQLAVSKL